jgi:hypothetical protein
MVGTTTTVRSEMMSEFLNEEAGRVYAKGRLYTREHNEGVQLVAYGHEVLAYIEDGHVHLFTGHHGTVSQTVTGYIKILGRVLSNTEGLEVTVHESEAPNTGIGTRLSDSAQYINAYVGAFAESLSAVEQNAKDTVERVLERRLEQEFGDE